MSHDGKNLSTNCAHWGWDDHRFFGHSVFEELAGHETMTGLTALAVLGRTIPKEHCEMLDDIVGISTLADPRIWPLKITRLVAAYGRVMPAVAAGVAIQQRAIVSPWMAADAAFTLQELHTAVADRTRDAAVVTRALDDYFSGHPIVPGFGMPCRNRDERLVALRACVQRRGRDQLPYWGLVTTIIANCAHLRFAPNIGLGIAAAMLDMGIATPEIGPLTSCLFQHMYYANAVEGAHDRFSPLRELPLTCVKYLGAEARTSARAQLSESTIGPTSELEPTPSQGLFSR